MSDHEPYVEETMAADCVYGECDHEDDCPNTPTVLCKECASLVEENGDGIQWFGDAEHWPCIHTTRTGREQEVVTQLLAVFK